MSSSNQKSNRAILLFTRSPENEARSKPLAQLSFAERVGLYELCTRHVLTQASALGYPILVATDEPDYNFARYSPNVAAVFQQRGDSFGNRLAHALHAAFAQGYEEVVCVGNDCLELTAGDLHTAFAQLAQHALTLGAAEDGGVYLIGVQRVSLPAVLRAVQECHWQTAIVLKDLLASAQRYAISTTILRAQCDLDTVGDLIRARQALPNLLFLKRFFSSLLARRILSSFTEFVFTPTSHYDRLRFQKAPPALLF